MSCVNNRYTPDELESIFVWDCLCEAIPLSSAERREITERDRAASSAGGKKRVLTEEQKQKNRESCRRWRQRNADRVKSYNLERREKREERQRI